MPRRCAGSAVDGENCNDLNGKYGLRLNDYGTTTPIAASAKQAAYVPTNVKSYTNAYGKTPGPATCAPSPRKPPQLPNPIIVSANRAKPAAEFVAKGIDIYGAWISNAQEDDQEAAEAWATVYGDVGGISTLLIVTNRYMWSNLWSNFLHQQPIKPPSEDPEDPWWEEEAGGSIE